MEQFYFFNLSVFYALCVIYANSKPNLKKNAAS